MSLDATQRAVIRDWLRTPRNATEPPRTISAKAADAADLLEELRRQGLDGGTATLTVERPS